MLTRIVHNRIGRKADLAIRRDDPAAPVAEDIPITSYRDGRPGDEMIGNDDVGDTYKMDV